MKKIIAIAGRAGSGKTTASLFISQRYGAKELAFANRLKMMAADIMGFSEKQLFGTQDDKESIDGRYKISPRTFMQRLGEAAREHIHRDIWANEIVRDIVESKDRVFVVSDLRHPEELNALEKLSASGAYDVCFIKLEGRFRAKANHNAPSEKGVDEIDISKFDYIINNNKYLDLRDFIDVVDDIAGYFLKESEEYDIDMDVTLDIEDPEIFSEYLNRSRISR